MQKFLCCDAANPKTHDDSKGDLTFQHSGQIGLPSRPTARPAHATNAPNLQVYRNSEITLVVDRASMGESEYMPAGQASRTKCAKRLSSLEFSYARIACVALGNEYTFIITSNEVALVCAAWDCAANLHDGPFRPSAGRARGSCWPASGARLGGRSQQPALWKLARAPAKAESRSRRWSWRRPRSCSTP